MAKQRVRKLFSTSVLGRAFSIPARTTATDLAQKKSITQHHTKDLAQHYSEANSSA
ncbi:hypothetical protein OESDEN_15265 [Oesophagostomum dentatum]|uniref:Uncharacterized protein n=1 Tax=Oesophagostomum dentatum TaxID=61180 RepID=A0A0B1SJC1_OESDE|nr:hypothetical protein OESDEN_15265 [Oesophagostomum dentatum]